MFVKGKQQQLEIMFGPTLQVACDVLAKSNQHRARQPDPTAQPERRRRRRLSRSGSAAGRAGERNPPATPNFVCFEPMAGITNAMNLAQKGIYKEQQYIAPNQTWEASFWVKPSGF